MHPCNSLQAVLREEITGYEVADVVTISMKAVDKLTIVLNLAVEGVAYSFVYVASMTSALWKIQFELIVNKLAH